MSHRVASAARGIAGLWRLALAVGLLVALWIGTVKGVERASHDADQRRVSDRSALASAFARSLAEWLDAGRTEAVTLSRSVGSGSGPAALSTIETFLAQPRTFSREAIVFRGSTVVAASSRYSVLIGLEPKPCSRVDETTTASDARLAELVATASGTSAPAISPILDVPGDCRPAVGVAASSGSVVTVVLGDPADASARLVAGSLISDVAPGRVSQDRDPNVPLGGTRVLAVTGDTALEPRQGVIATQQRVRAFVSEAEAGGADRARYPVGEGSGAEVVAAYAPVGDGWSIVLEQDAAVFDIEMQNRPSLIVASSLTVVFAIVFVLLALFDRRRQRERRRTETAKNAFFSIAGHELRTPLTVLKGFAETLSSNWSDLDDERRHDLVDRMVPQTRRLGRLVERLLVAASIQAETNTPPDVRPTDPAEALEGVAQRFRAEAPLHTFEVRVEGGVPDVLADPEALAQVLDHLVDNAVKYSPAGGTVRLRAVERRRRVDVAVEDEGVGLPSDHKAIFERFVQGESVTTRVHDEGGVGLGLFIVRTLVEQMGGSVRAEPRRAGGARFVVSLRAIPSPARSTETLKVS